MAKQTVSEIEQLIEYARPTNRDLARLDINQVMRSPVSALMLKVVPYCYNDGTSKDLLSLYGTVVCNYKGNRYHIPIEIWLQQDHPNVSPMVYVKPTSDMYVSPASKDVRPDGTVVIPYLRNWRHPQSDLATLIFVMSEAFSLSPPVYSNGQSNRASLSQLDTLSSTSIVSPYVSNKLTSTSSASLPITHDPTSNVSSNNVSKQKHTHRFSDIVAEPRRMLLPIQGFETMALVSLEEAIAPLVSLIPDVEQMVWICKQNCIHPKDGLTSDESASIMLYTMEWQPYEKSFYVILNAALRAANRDELKLWFLYLRLVVNALEKLPITSPVVYRGIKLDLNSEYCRGNTVVWWGFSSCTLSIETLNNERFLGRVE